MVSVLALFSNDSSSVIYVKCCLKRMKIDERRWGWPIFEQNYAKCFFFKMGHSRPLFSLFSSFQYTVDSKQMFNKFCQ